VLKKKEIAAEKKANKMAALAQLKAKKMAMALEQQAVPMLDVPEGHTEREQQDNAENTEVDVAACDDQSAEVLSHSELTQQESDAELSIEVDVTVYDDQAGEFLSLP